MIYRFPENFSFTTPEFFNNPFRYHPHPLVQKAAEILTGHIHDDIWLHSAFSEGKMLGVLVVGLPDCDDIGFIAAFSGNVGGRSNILGFVPPIFDLMDPSGHFKTREAEITELNRKIASIEDSGDLSQLKEAIAKAMAAKEEEIAKQKAHMAISKRERDEARSEMSDPARLDALLKESMFEKAELKRIRIRWDNEIKKLQNEAETIISGINEMKARRAAMSDELQKWIFRQYIVHDFTGSQSSIEDIFAAEGLIPPGGTGECAAPKLLEYAYENRLRPIAMGEFWYGASPKTAVRTHGRFYPSCTSKCGPLLRFMLNGILIKEDPSADGSLEIIYEDNEVVAVEKPSGMPSVPGLDGRLSAYEILCRSYEELHTVHRLDMDTSGIILFAKTEDAAKDIRHQFEQHTVKKTYHARLSPAAEGMKLKPGDQGEISLPLSADYDERPRQKVDMAQGKPALTSYEVTAANDDGTIDIAFHPHTGRTHQLRVHSAHSMGLGHPIIGDMLYGGLPATHLHLHAWCITFIHPSTHAGITLTSIREQ